MPTKKSRITGDPPIESREQFEMMVDVVASLTTQLNSKEADLARDVQKVQAQYSDKIKNLKLRIKLAYTQCSAYAAEHREELFPKGKKSAGSSLAIFGFRTGQPQLKTLSGWTLKKAVVAIRKARRRRFLRITYAVDKEALLKAASAFKDPSGLLSPFGLRRVQEEPFYIEPKTEKAERKTA